MADQPTRFGYIAVIEAMQALLKQHGSSKAAADALGISPQYWSDIVRGRRDLSDNVLEKLGFVRTITYSRIGGPRMVVPPSDVEHHLHLENGWEDRHGA